jgi:SAM-dependent methyltransferase
VVGADLSTYLLDVARTRTREAGLAVEYVHSDMRELPFTGEFDVAVNLFTAFGYFAEEEEHQRALSRFAQALRPGGRLVLEMINRDGLFGRFQPLAWQELPNGVLALIRRRFDPHRGRIEVEQVLRRPGGDLQSLSHSFRLLPTEELVRLFRGAGLHEVELFEGLVPRPGSSSGPLQPYAPESRRVCVTGRKPA